jgi:hypothetical protein
MSLVAVKLAVKSEFRTDAHLRHRCLLDWRAEVAGREGVKSLDHQDTLFTEIHPKFAPSWRTDDHLCGFHTSLAIAFIFSRKLRCIPGVQWP